MVKTVTGPEAPSWARRQAQQTDRNAGVRAAKPLGLQTFATTAALPPPAAWQASIVFNVALGVPCMSDGVHWYPISVGAHL